jgi:16S rRNA (guanine527-N7)-methyltransferase
MKGESAATEIAEAQLKGVKTIELHEIELEGIGLGRIIELRKGA